jgi:hypothetical protein
MTSHSLPTSRAACSPPCSGGRSSPGTPIALTAATYQNIRASSALCLNRSAVPTTDRDAGSSAEQDRRDIAQGICRVIKPVDRSQRPESPRKDRNVSSRNQAARVRLVMCARYAAADFMLTVPAWVNLTISALARRAACAV